MNARFLVVDLGGVVCELDQPGRLAALSRLTGLPAGRVHELLWDSGFGHDCDTGRYPDADAVRAGIRAALAPAGGALAVDSVLDEAWCGAYRPVAGVLAALTECAGDRTLALFTDNGPLEEDGLVHRHPGVFGQFDLLFFTWRLGVTKADPRAYRAVAAALAADPAEILFVDDRPDNVALARSVGWHATIFSDADALRGDLRTH